MAGEWEEIPFSEAVLLNPAAPLARGTVYPFVEMSAITAGTRDVTCSEHREFTGGGSRFQDRDTLMARITPCLENGKLARFYAPEGEPVGHGSTEFIVVRGRPAVTNNDYAYYLTISPEVRAFAISQMTGSSGRQRVPTDALGGISVLLPPLAEQKAIAAVLGALDDKIELNRQMNATLEAMARALFQSWFVDFDPVRAKLDGRQAGGLDHATAAHFPAAFQDSPIGQVPSGWLVVSLYDTARWVNGAAFRSEDFSATGDGLPVIKIGELKAGIGTQTKWSNRQAEPDQVINTGDLLYSWSGSPDTSLEAFLWSGGRGLLNQHIFKVIAQSASQKRFVYYLLQYLRPVLVEIARNKQTTGLGHVTIADMKRLLVCMPSKEVLDAFDQSAAAIFDRAFVNTLESRTLVTLRDTLLPKLLSGKLRLTGDATINAMRGMAYG